MRCTSRGQVSIEYVMVIGFAMLLLIPIILIFFIETTDLNDSVNTNMAREASRSMIEHAELVYFMGAPSFIEVTINFPENINTVTITGDQVTFNIETQAGDSDVFEVGTVNITGSVGTYSGKHNLRIQATGNQVNISEIQ